MVCVVWCTNAVSFVFVVVDGLGIKGRGVKIWEQADKKLARTGRDESGPKIGAPIPHS